MSIYITGAIILDFTYLRQILLSPFNRAWNICLLLFGLSVCTSKSLFTMMTLVIILWTVIDKTKRSICLQNKWILLIASLFPLAVLFNFFSIGGFASSMLLIKSWYWPLAALPVCIMASDRKSLTPLLVGLLFGLVIANGYSYLQAVRFLNLHQDIPFMSDAFRITSFWDISRWGVFSGFLILMLLQLIPRAKPLEKRIYFLVFLLTLIPFLITNSRAPLLAVSILSIVLILCDQKVKKYAAMLVLSLVIFAGTIPSYQERFASIFQVQMKKDQLVSTNQSNLGRLNMWKVATDFFREQPVFGTGFENSERPLRSFLERQSPEYVKSYVSQEFSYRDQHSSYLTVLVQFGLLFTVFCFLLFSAIIIKTVQVFFVKKTFSSKFALLGLAYCFIIFFFYSAFNSYESVLFFILLGTAALSFTSEQTRPQADTL